MQFFITESLSTEKKQLFKVEADLKDKITNLFTGTDILYITFTWIIVAVFVICGFDCQTISALYDLSFYNVHCIFFLLNGSVDVWRLYRKREPVTGKCLFLFLTSTHSQPIYFPVSWTSLYEINTGISRSLFITAGIQQVFH